MRLIDADAVISGVKHRCIGQDDVVKVEHSIITMIHMMPTVDAVPVVRCKDCIWNREKEWVDCYMSGMHGRNTNNFCSRGERK